jgi:ATP-dependent exoDNAse (exonuclease V) alpha subunit
MNDKQRLQLIHQFIRKNRPQLELIKQIHAADAMLPLWKANPTLAIHEIWDRYQNPIQDSEKKELGIALDVWLKEQREKKTEAEEGHQEPVITFLSPVLEEEEEEKPHETFSLDIELNARQQLAVDFAKAGKSFVLTGAAGTGKTTAERWIVKALLERGGLGIHAFKDRRTGIKHKAPGIAVVSFTNKAANTSRKAIHMDPWLAEEVPFNITTIHNLLEFMPVFFDRPDGTKGMVFEPQRNRYNPLDIKVLIVEEASNVGALDLYQLLYDAIRPNTTLIFVGDINQLPPIFSPPILSYALNQLPVVELVDIYRQAQDSPIISNAHRILAGKPLEERRPHFAHISGKKLAKSPGAASCTQQLVKHLKQAIDKIEDGESIYDPDQDIILSPYNKGECGTIEINNHIAQFLGLRRKAEVWEVIAGLNRHYLAVGDRVFFMKREAIITKISLNGGYMGRTPKPQGMDLTRWGMRVKIDGQNETEGGDEKDFELEIQGYENMNIDDIPDGEIGRKQASSHIIDLEYVDSEMKDTLSTAGEFSQAYFGLGYALTVHKAQGSEWRKVFILIHKSQIAHLNREMLYTAVTRARTHCMIVDFSDIVDKVISQQRIKGNSVEEKIAFFNSEISLKEPIRVLKD